MSRNRSVSTIIATHNRPGLVVRTLDCLARQSRPPKEVVVVDDGSQAETGRAIAAWQRDCEPGFKLIYHWQTNAGPAVARNRGVTLSSGELIHFMDDDDLMHEAALETLATVINQDEPVVAMASYRNRWEDGRVDACVHPPRLLREDRLASMIGGTWFVPIHGYLFTRSAIDQMGPWSTVLSSQEDDEYLLRAALGSVKFVCAPEALVDYFQHSGVRRATPGKPGESVFEGLKERLTADLKIREAVFEYLQARGKAGRYRRAFQKWEQRLRDRYQVVLDQEDITSPLLDWLATTADQLDRVWPTWPWGAGAVTDMRRARPVASAARSPVKIAGPATLQPGSSHRTRSTRARKTVGTSRPSWSGPRIIS